MRGPLAWPALPVMISRSAKFDELVLDAAEAIERKLGHELGVELAVEDVPPSDPAPWEHGVALGRLFPAERNLPARLVVYRRPLTQRALDDADLAAVVHEVLAEQIARMLGRDPDDLL
ncbi:MAG: metallopeptidase family protein [Ornithinimicrobium sp.]|uniref:metallopeptidase family protein n=1 Tax=Ornithinimicrobium sp. TaxID=1977084 RepID=UPI0026E02A2D|nr:metallopeptidase family protein [Ornithinimicrobium sp.]MDO5739569.1 metallopeptidase family protein [Ornithinimicrobium sp.]